MATKPTVDARWARTSGGVDAPNIAVPASGQLDTGFNNGQVPPSGYQNWWQNLVHKWLLYLRDAIFVADAGSGLDGVKATGDGAGAGGNFAGGATGPGAKFSGLAGGSGRGAINIVPQAGDPGIPSNGDVWYDSVTNAIKARVNGATDLISGHPFLYVYGTAVQSIPNNTDTRVAFPSVGQDSDSGWNAANNWYVIPAGKGGLYLIIITVTLSVSYTGAMQVSLMLNNGLFQKVAWGVDNATLPTIQISSLVKLNAGDTISANLTQVSGGAAVSAGGGLTNLMLKRIPD